ncbi:MAG: UDP-N-acetylmuramoyl-L-alanyl-D-glutamate--2,6-diaminopimelate ligase [Rhodothermia bacterium]|nr:UDP-N-acetylmuramoyl-L-alanyl-D-glutamate--2,6-diaminopimelate ligase [Rhodothermia bacterium]
MRGLITLTDRLRRRGLLAEADPFDKDVQIDRLVNDSRKVGPNAMFVAIKGDEVDGHLFIDKAVENGAIAIVCETVPGVLRNRHPGTVFATVTDSRTAWAELSAGFFDDPGEELTLIGTTGTNGKSTTAYLIYEVLASLGTTCGLIGTISYRVGDRETPATHTTPDAYDLAHLLRDMRSEGCSACSMEVSSHALEQKRVAALRFQVGVFTNLTQDHLDYHGSFENYLESKKLLFTGLGPDATAVYNADDPSAEKVVSETRAHTLSFGQSDGADVRFEVLDKGLDGLVLCLDGVTRQYRLVGSFNAYNISAAYCAARALDFQSGDVIEALAAAPPVPGRFEQLPVPGGGLVIVDYAHTPDALANVLRSARSIAPPKSRLICVFGCGGDRDPDKRSRMGAIAESLADQVVVTSDNPRSEDPVRILDDIRTGLREPDDALWIVDREQAIEAAAAAASPNDIVVIAGKGHETYQVVDGVKIPFDDRVVARRVFGLTDPGFTS